MPSNSSCLHGIVQKGKLGTCRVLGPSVPFDRRRDVDAYTLSVLLGQARGKHATHNCFHDTRLEFVEWGRKSPALVFDLVAFDNLSNHVLARESSRVRVRKRNAQRLLDDLRKILDEPCRFPGLGQREKADEDVEPVNRACRHAERVQVIVCANVTVEPKPLRTSAPPFDGIKAGPQKTAARVHPLDHQSRGRCHEPLSGRMVHLVGEGDGRIQGHDHDVVEVGVKQDETHGFLQVEEGSAQLNQKAPPVVGRVVR